jgi:hypothetical protein
MAGLRCVQTFSGIAGVSSAYKTLVNLKTQTNQRIKITAVRLGGTGITTTDPPVLVQLLVQSGTPSGGVTGSPVKLDDEMTETIQTQTLTGPTSGAWGTEPTAGNVKYQDAIHPQGRIPEVFFQPELWVAGNSQFGLRVNVQSGAVNAFYGSIFWEE